MWKNSTELLDYVLREIQVAIASGKPNVKIVLKKSFLGNTDKIYEFCNSLELKKIADMLREEFNDYQIEGVVSKEYAMDGMMLIFTYENGPCDTYCSLVWKLTLSKKMS